MTTISVVVPTIDGRENLLAATKAAYTAHSDGVELEWIEVRNRPTCGEAWNAGANAATGDYLHLSADDIEPHDGWVDAAIRAAEHNLWPAPHLLRPDGSTEACGSMGGGMLLADCPDWTPCLTSPFPFMDRAKWTADACLPIHYYADDWLAHVARVSGMPCVVAKGYRFTHLEGTVGRPRVAARAMQDRGVYLGAVTAIPEGAANAR